MNSLTSVPGYALSLALCVGSLAVPRVAVSGPAAGPATNEGASARSALVAFVEAARASRLRDVELAMTQADPQQVDHTAVLAELAVAQAKLDAAMRAKFGEAHAGRFFPTVDATQAARAEGAPDAAGQEQRFVIGHDDGKRMARVRCVNGAWRIADSIVTAPIQGPTATDAPQRYREMSIVLGDAAAEVRDGHFPSANEAISKIMPRLEAAEAGMNNQ